MWELLTPLVVFRITSDFITFITHSIIAYYLFKFGIKEIIILRSKIMILLASFVFSCGILHLTYIINEFYSIYWVIGTMKLLCAITSTMAVTSVFTVLDTLRAAQDLNLISGLKELKNKLDKLEL